MSDVLSKRDRSVLQAIISCYIDSGEPVGSRYLSKKLDFNLSSATIRNIMSDLEEMGYLKQPHISAGRIPTDKAYRFHVDCLVQGAPQDPTILSLNRFYRGLKGEPGDLMRETSKVLSDVSHYVGLVLTPPFINTVLKHIEFVRLRKDRVLAILVSGEGIIQNKLVITDKDYSPADLEKISSLLNADFANRPLREVRARIIEEMTEDKKLYDSLLEKGLSLCRKSLDIGQKRSDVYVEGASNIFSLPEFSDVEKMRALFRAFEEKNHLVDLLDRCIDAEGVKIFIGAENPYREMQDFSLVTAPYRKEGQVLGVIGVLGPTRMEYQRVIPMVDYTARYLGKVLSRRF